MNTGLKHLRFGQQAKIYDSDVHVRAFVQPTSESIEGNRDVVQGQHSETFRVVTPESGRVQEVTNLPSHIYLPEK